MAIAINAKDKKVMGKWRNGKWGPSQQIGSENVNRQESVAVKVRYFQLRGGSRKVMRLFSGFGFST